MGRINLLSFEVANLIAAGEVVDRPASAIKELMENSIDAGAKHITVEIQNGGVTFMRVSDDGCGMEPEDLPMAIRRHATSKISSASDLDGICTLGFRGEALAAISSVSRMRIISKTRNAVLGAALTVNCGEVEELREQGCSDGTTIIAEELFANVPARRKFLKRDVTETTAVCANVEKIALSHPEIAFKLISDGQLKLETAGDGKLQSAIYSIFGRDFASKLIEVDGDYDGISVKGYIGRSDNVKGNRNYQNFYINKRFVKSKTATAALEQAFVSYLPAERFPVCVLFLSLNPGRVDVNVHPAKLEVKFSNEKPIFEAIYYSVKQALEHNTTRPEIEARMPGQTAQSQRTLQNNASGSLGMRMSDAFVPVEREQSLKSRQISMDIGQASRISQKPSMQDKQKMQSQDAQSVKSQPQERITAKQYLEEYLGIKQPEDKKQTESERKSAPAQMSAQVPAQVSAQVPAQVSAQVPVQTASEEVVSESEPRELVSWRLVGEVFNSYLLVECGEKMLIVDKHAAHERIIFEELKANMYKAESASQLLMLPIEVMLMTDEIALIEQYRGEIEGVGFGFTTARNTVSVTEIPIGIEQNAVPDMLAVIADRLKHGTGDVNITKNIIFEKALYQASCKAAIKAGREYPEGHAEWIVKKLMEIPDITFCPHGRPVAMEMSKRSIDRQFERT